jgi:hypothetical protein
VHRLVAKRVVDARTNMPTLTTLPMIIQAMTTLPMIIQAITMLPMTKQGMIMKQLEVWSRVRH